MTTSSGRALIDDSPWADWGSDKPELSTRENGARSPDAWVRVEADESAARQGGHYHEDSAEEELQLWEDSSPQNVRDYKQGSTIDWMHEENVERARKQLLRSQLGVRGIFFPVLDSWRMWAVLILTGLSIGYTGGMLDLLVAWLSDLRTGRCLSGLTYNQSACCNGLDPGEICYEWVTWSAYFGVTSIAGQSILQSFVYVALALCFAGSAAFLVQSYAPYAFHTGIPEIKAILGGLVLDQFLSPWTLLIKALGLALSVASGLSLGKEGPLVHVSCCMASLWTTILSFTSPSLGNYFQNQSQSQRRKLLAAAATAGVAVAFGSPLGGVLFGLEELDSALFSNQQLMWRAFVTSVVAATTLAYIDPFGIGKLVLFQVTASQQWRQFELVPWLGLGVLGGVLGALLIRLNVRFALYRNSSPLRDMHVFEVLAVTAITAIISWPIVFMRDQTSTLVANLFQECDPSKDYHGLCNVYVAEHVLAAAYGGSEDSPDRMDIRNASTCGMTVSLVVILFELTGALSHVLPIMLAVMSSKFVGDYLGKGIYDTWIAMHGYPYLPPSDFRDRGETAASVMTSTDKLVVLYNNQSTPSELGEYRSPLMVARASFWGTHLDISSVKLLNPRGFVLS
ncbi:hypothetical protein FRB90_000074 [Tulasnella sp. 427]|nr:hypothetical protein FRB90_000074 [Tulasnella sp. 427]